MATKPNHHFAVPSEEPLMPRFWLKAPDQWRRTQTRSFLPLSGESVRRIT